MNIKTLLIDRIPFHDWPADDRKIALASIIPWPLPSGEGRWTVKERMALDLLRFGMPEARSFQRIPKRIIALRQKLAEEGVDCDHEVLVQLHDAMERVELRKGFLESFELE